MISHCTATFSPSHTTSGAQRVQHPESMQDPFEKRSDGDQPQPIGVRVMPKDELALKKESEQKDKASKVIKCRWSSVKEQEPDVQAPPGGPC